MRKATGEMNPALASSGYVPQTDQKLAKNAEEVEIRSSARPDCYVCGEHGEMLHDRLRDRLFGAPGNWSIRRCPSPGCGLAWLDPMPLREDIPKAYQNYHTHYDSNSKSPDSFGRRVYRTIKNSYLASRYGYEAAENSGWKQLLGYLAYLTPTKRASADGSVFFLDSRRNGRLLEVGCGNGLTLKSLEGLGWQVEGLDFDPAAVECARKKGLRVHLGTLEAQRLPTDSFDAIVSSHVIEHVPNPTDLLVECRRLLKPGGRLAVITPNMGGWGHRIYGANWRGLEPPRHLHIFTAESLAVVCARAGFTACECRSMVRGNGILQASSMLRRFGRTHPEQPPIGLRLWAKAAGFIQGAGLFVDRQAGDEIILTCAK